jgi:predicted phosphohydrolase
MAIWAIGDLHLSFGVPGKEMSLFGDLWNDHHEKIKAFWDANVHPDDLVLIPGDISWAMRLAEAEADLKWVDERPGTKVMIRGNHDYWWDSASKIRKVLPPSLHIISNDAYLWNDVAIGGVRLWDTSEFRFGPFIQVSGPKPLPVETTEKLEEDDKVFQRELSRLELSLKAMKKDASLKIVMTHYPPISADLKDSSVSKLLESYGIHICVFGHLHSLKKESKLFGVKNDIAYHLVSCDWLNFRLHKIA